MSSSRGAHTGVEKDSPAGSRSLGSGSDLGATVLGVSARSSWEVVSGASPAES